MENLQGGTLALEHRYHLDARLDSTGLITLYAATQDPFQLPVRVAVYDGLPEAGASPALIERIKASAARASDLDLPGLLGTADYGEVDAGIPFVIEEALPGASLAALISQKGVLSPPDVAALIDRLAALLQGAHDKGIFHGSLQPRWILIPEGKAGLANARLGHFGLGFSMAELLGMEQAVLTTDLVDAFPPEAFDAASRDEESGASAGRPHLSADADQWALAALAYRLLVGVHPFFDDPVDASEGLLRIKSEEAPPLSDMGISEEISEAIARGLRNNPARRWPSVKVFAEKLHKAVHGAPADAPSPSAPESALSEHTGPSEHRETPSSQKDPQIQKPAAPAGPRPSGYLLTFALAALLLSNLAWFFFFFAADEAPLPEPVQEEASTFLSGLQLDSAPQGAQIFVVDAEQAEPGDDAPPIGSTPYVLSAPADGGPLHVLLRHPDHDDQRLSIEDTAIGQDIRLILSPSE